MIYGKIVQGCVVMKSKTVFVCSDCGAESSKWMGRCTACSAWNTLTEEVIYPQNGKNPYAMYGKELAVKNKALPISEICVSDEVRVSSGISEFDRVLGGGIVEGSLILVGGDPGIGKSTLLTQLCTSINLNDNILYASGEESQRQIKLRASRLGVENNFLHLISETNLDVILQAVANVKPKVLIVDSVQTVYKPSLPSVPGSVSQVREVSLILMRLAKEQGITVFLVGHVTKDGSLAGPRVLEHMVDCVLYFEGERYHHHRILRAVKNRFGSTNEIGVFEMTNTGLEEVKNPSEMLLSGRPQNAPGSCIVCTLEGSRPILAEIQSLVCSTSFNIPRRMSAGIEFNRVSMLMAVLEKRAGLNLASHDAYVNVIGGLKIDEPAADLAVVLAVASGFRNRALDNGLIAVGEVGLTGELRSVSLPEKRIIEAEKLGFNTFVMPESNLAELGKSSSLKLNSVELKFVPNIGKALELF